MKNSLNQTIRQQLTKLKLNDMTLEEISVMSGINKTKLWRIFNIDTPITLDLIDKLIKANLITLNYCSLDQ